MKVSEIAEQLAINPNTVFHMKSRRSWDNGKTKGRIVETTTEKQNNYSWCNKTRTCYVVEVMERDYRSDGSHHYSVMRLSERLLPQHIYGVWSETTPLEDECVSYGESMTKASEARQRNDMRKMALATFIIAQAKRHSTEPYFYHASEWQVMALGLPFLEALAKALGYTEPTTQAHDHTHA